MIIRHATKEDLDEIMNIYAIAKAYMDKNGNPGQWINGYPKKELIESDIAKKVSYVCVEGDEVVAVFAFILGEDPTYNIIYDGAWLNDEDYGTIHRIASNGKVKNIFKICLDYCLTKVDNVRCDTHNDNITMQKLFEKTNFTKCGIIYVADGSQRIAYHLVK